MGQQVSRICKECGKVFFVSSPRNRSVVCSEECLRNRKREQTYRSKGIKIETHTKVCATCGKEYQTKRAYSKTCCTECSAIYGYITSHKNCKLEGEELKKVAMQRWKENREAQTRCRAYKKGYHYAKPTKTKRKSFDEIDDIQKRAQAEGLSYGKYVAKYGL